MKSSRTRWICVKNSSGCKAAIVTLDDVIIQASTEHVHNGPSRRVKQILAQQKTIQHDSANKISTATSQDLNSQTIIKQEPQDLALTKQESYHQVREELHPKEAQQILHQKIIKTELFQEIPTNQVQEDQKILNEIMMSQKSTHEESSF